MERFAVDGRVDVVDRDDAAKFFNAKPRNVLCEKHFYSVETDDGRDASLEKMFSTHVEGPAHAAFKRVFDDGYSPDAPGRRAAISLFLAFRCVRGPGTPQAGAGAGEQAGSRGRESYWYPTPSEQARAMVRSAVSSTPTRVAADPCVLG